MSTDRRPQIVYTPRLDRPYRIAAASLTVTAVLFGLIGAYLASRDPQACGRGARDACAMALQIRGSFSLVTLGLAGAAAVSALLVWYLGADR
ncbi:MAG: hypothetical protein QOJ50_1843 [Cryptosporangiaceae bacterium]|jgi:hypothetical protein|nr:hypothetical protein [Cryptosporangiaceae bacterium]